MGAPSMPARARRGRVVAALGQGLGRLLDLAFPRLCPLCGAVSDREGRLVCWACFTRLPLHAGGAFCRICGLVPEGEADGGFLCDVCRRDRPAFDLARTAAPFRGGLRTLLHDFKYRNATWLRADLTDWLEGAFRAHLDAASIDWVLPVPLHAARLRQRGYNQAALLAVELARRCGLATRNDLLCRLRATPTQTRLSAAGRRANVRGVFTATQPAWIRGRTVLVVDDVMTTGATLDEAARCLKQAGAWRVWALAVARG